MSPLASALSQEDKNAIDRDSVHYAIPTASACDVGSTADTPEGTSVCCTTDTGTTETVTLPGNSKGSNGEKLFVYLIQKGLTAKQAAGILGNVMQESGGGTFNINPDALNPTSGAYGIIQWYAGRKTNLLNYASSVGKPKNDLGMQLDFMWKELSGAYKSTVLDPIKATSDYLDQNGREGSLRIWLEDFEIPCSPDGGAACNAEYSKRKPFADRAYAAFKDLGPADVSPSGVGSCDSGQGGSAVVDASGYAFPVVLPKTDISNGYSWPCRTSSPYCHHDGTAAFDLAKKALNDSTAGTPVVAIFDGSITNINPNYDGTGCQSIQFKGDDGWYYWYGHIRTDGTTPKVGQKVKAGDHLAKIGERVCTANGSYPHLHIDRGSPKGRTAGEDCCRDPGFLSLMNELYKNLP